MIKEEFIQDKILQQQADMKAFITVFRYLKQNENKNNRPKVWYLEILIVHLQKRTFKLLKYGKTN